MRCGPMERFQAWTLSSGVVCSCPRVQADLFIVSTERWQLANPDWKFDIIPEIIDGKTIYDFVDPDIENMLEELEREENARVQTLEEQQAMESSVRISDKKIFVILLMSRNLRLMRRLWMLSIRSELRSPCLSYNRNQELMLLATMILLWVTRLTVAVGYILHPHTWAQATTYYKLCSFVAQCNPRVSFC